MAEPRNLECLTCGWLYPVLDDTLPADWENHGDAREPVESVDACPTPDMQWVVE